MRVIKPKPIYNENWKKLFEHKLVTPQGTAYNLESTLLAALHEVKIFDFDSARHDLKTAIMYVRMLREALPPVGAPPKKPGPVLIKK
jgi:hypothetical protein